MSEVANLNRIADLEGEVIVLRGLLKRASNFFKANYSYIYTDKETMDLWDEIDDEL